MKQETGSKGFSSVKDKVSIQLKLSGHRFSIDSSDGPGISTQTVLICGSKATLVPEESLESFSPKTLVEMAGHPVSDDDTIVTCRGKEGITCLAAIPTEAIKSLESRFGKQITYTSPLLDFRHEDAQCLVIGMYDGVMFIHAFNGGLKRAEAFDIESDADVVLIAKSTMDGAGLNPDSTIYYSGEKKTFKVLHRYFRNTRCE